jgi:uncharacterized membrane protein
MNEERFSASDLEPSDEEKSRALRGVVERVAATVAVLAAGVWVGGMLALGACAAPFVFRLTPAPYSGDAMGAAFARFDQVALGAAVLLLGAEVTRTWAAGARGRSPAARVRRGLALIIAACAAYTGLSITPHINALHRAGAQRGQGQLGEELEVIHRRAELLGKAETVLGVALVGLHVFTLGARRPDDDEEGHYAEPLPPGGDV